MLERLWNDMNGNDDGDREQYRRVEKAPAKMILAACGIYQWAE
jgi:hypothetical protein